MNVKLNNKKVDEKQKKRAKAGDKPTPTERPTNQDVAALRMLVRAREDFQAMRKAMDNRIARKANGESQDLIEDRYFHDYDRVIFEGIADESRQKEKEIEKQLQKILSRFPVWTDFLSQIKGVGPIAAGHIIGEININEASTVSKIWQFAGLNSGMVRGKKSIAITKKTDTSQLIKQYETRDGKKVGIILTDEMIRGDKLTPGFVSPFNKKLRVALCGVLADGLVKACLRWETIGENEYVQSAFTRIKDDKYQRAVIDSKYVRLYMDIKWRYSQSEKEVMHCGKMTAWKDTTPGHRDAAAKRYMIKMFLKDLYVAWRTIEGLPVREPYQEDYLGHKH